MQHIKGPESPELGRTLSRSRSTSMSSDSQLSRIHLLSPPPVNPPPSFIASSAAAQIITADQEFNTADFVTSEEDNGANASALVTPEALSALNGFLDHLLYNILAAAKSTQLQCIRPAIAEVLKPRLAREVVSAADDELSEYMGGEEDEQSEFRGGQSSSNDFDLVRSWKLTRLRCMVYTRLGDMEEDDEDEYIAQDQLVESDDGIPPRFNSHVGNITPAAAIFLTSIIEHIGEQALIIAGETARSRLSWKLNDNHDEVTESGAERSSMDRLVVEELDMEKLALNPTLGRLWRTWRRRVRTRSLSRTISRESFQRRRLTAPSAGSRKSSIATVDEYPPGLPLSQAVEPSKELDPASVALPMSEHDVEEIEIPGYVADLDGSEVHDIQEVRTMQAVVAHKVRPHSLMVLNLASPRSTSSTGNSPVTPPSAQSARVTRHVRSRSLPSTPCPQDDIPEDAPSPKARSATAAEEQKRLETMYEHDEDDEQAVPNESVQKVTVREVKQLETGNASSEQSNSAVVQDAATASSPSAASEVTVTPEVKQLETGNSSSEQTSSAAVQDAATASSPSAASVDAVTSQTSSTDTSTASLSDEQELVSEVIEGRGLCEKPKLAALQRPKRVTSRGSSLDTAASPTEEKAPRAVTVVDHELQTQRGSATPSHPADSSDASKTSEENLSAAQAPPARASDSTSDGKSSRSSPVPAEFSRKEVTGPVSTVEEPVLPARSQSRPVPSPLSLKTAGQQSFGPTSPGSATPGSAGTERAAVQRVSRPSTSVASSTNPKPRRSDSFSSHREKRPVTAGSTTSQVSSKLKGLIGRQTDSSTFLVRTSSENSRASAVTPDSVYNDTSGLDELIQSEKTIHYTLTPKNMRDIEDMDSPRWAPPRSPTADSPRWAPPRSPTADLADFLKNTGPPGSETSRPRTSKSSSREPTDFPRASKSMSRERAKYVPIQIPGVGPEQRDRSSARPGAPRLEARSAVAPRRAETADLVEFLREGPPNVGAYQVPRTIASSRETMDMDELRRNSPSVASTQRGSMATRSPASVGSRTALLESANRSTAQGGSSAANLSSSGDLSGPQPARKQRRVRDPYAIDDSDDDDFFEGFLESSKPKREEESLIDFLRNVPPPEVEPQPLALNITTSKSTSTGLGSASAMKARLLRHTSFDKSLSVKSSKSSLRQQQEGYLTGQSNYTVKVGMERNGGAMHAGYGLSPVSEKQTETSALASFLRSTGPPEPPTGRQSSLSSSSKDSTSLSRLFVRRKKVEV
ncbi:hypothetical protein CNMCM5793_005191 [Aspergillus hiratsukae]|uniref:Flo11 n=1 Tax=Aspergillus hiratsukae TaxID=1194566 RepID=A0A8H6Q3M9_9EURO|nr:hypothetical protein CNMCM5793_005191 [Aspergillus hiratsukae]KAF7166561.1 hypothetical protein CNMCM6106_002336 [Aspergillus hiratsukae]